MFRYLLEYTRRHKYLRNVQWLTSHLLMGYRVRNEWLCTACFRFLFDMMKLWSLIMIRHISLIIWNDAILRYRVWLDPLDFAGIHWNARKGLWQLSSFHSEILIIARLRDIHDTDYTYTADTNIISLFFPHMTETSLALFAHTHTNTINKHRYVDCQPLCAALLFTWNGWFQALSLSLIALIVFDCCSSSFRRISHRTQQTLVDYHIYRSPLVWIHARYVACSEYSYANKKKWYAESALENEMEIKVV